MPDANGRSWSRGEGPFGAGSAPVACIIQGLATTLEPAMDLSPVKQVIVVNESLRLPPGKLAALVAHAAVAAFLVASTDSQRTWLTVGMPKVVLGCSSLESLTELETKARAANLPVAVIRDAGRTVVAAGTQTCLGIGPASDEAIDSITGELKLIR